VERVGVYRGVWGGGKDAGVWFFTKCAYLASRLSHRRSFPFRTSANPRDVYIGEQNQYLILATVLQITSFLLRLLPTRIIQSRVLQSTRHLTTTISWHLPTSTLNPLIPPLPQHLVGILTAQPPSAALRRIPTIQPNRLHCPKTKLRPAQGTSR
jgi:hypothetical protein